MALNANSGIKTSVMLILVALEGPLFVTLIVKLTRLFTQISPVTLTYLITVRLVTGLTVTSVPLVVPVIFSVELTDTVFLNVPLVKTLTTTQRLLVVPLFKLGIFHDTVRVDEFQIPLELTYWKLECNTSLILTLVALEGPLFVTLIVKLTRLFTQISPVTLTYLITVRLVTGLTVTSVPLVVPVIFSVELTDTVFLNVPLVKTFTTTQRLLVVPLFKLGIFHDTVRVVAFHKPPAEVELKANSGIKTSLMLTLVAFDGPLLVTLIVKLTRLFTQISPVTLTCLITVKLFTGLTVISVPLVVPVLFSVELTVTLFLNVPLAKILTTTHPTYEEPLFKRVRFQTTL